MNDVHAREDDAWSKAREKKPRPDSGTRRDASGVLSKNLHCAVGRSIRVRDLARCAPRMRNSTHRGREEC
jgi:hypothetical protein